MLHVELTADEICAAVRDYRGVEDASASGSWRATRSTPTLR